MNSIKNNFQTPNFKYVKSEQNWEGRSLSYYVCERCGLQFSVSAMMNDKLEFIAKNHPTEECDENLIRSVQKS
jgi:hypothetical protein